MENLLWTGVLQSIAARAADVSSICPFHLLPNTEHVSRPNWHHTSYLSGLQCCPICSRQSPVIREDMKSQNEVPGKPSDEWRTSSIPSASSLQHPQAPGEAPLWRWLLQDIGSRTVGVARVDLMRPRYASRLPGVHSLRPDGQVPLSSLALMIAHSSDREVAGLAGCQQCRTEVAFGPRMDPTAQWDTLVW